MRTRRGLCYPRADVFVDKLVVKRRDFAGDNMACRKRQRFLPEIARKSDLFDALPDDLVISILGKLSSIARCPSDFINVLITYVGVSLDFLVILFLREKFGFFCCFLRIYLFCENRCKRLNSLALHSLVLSKASPKMFAIKAKNWSESAHRFLKTCADAGNVEACYTLGMVS